MIPHPVEMKTPHLTLGALFVAIGISCVIYGVSCNQAVYYFRHYKKDSWKIKTAVAAVWLLETLNTVFSAHALMSFVIYNRRAGPSYPFPWTISVQASTNTLIGTIVQIFFAWRVWILSVRRLWLTAVLVVLSMTQCVLGQILTLYGLGAVNPLAKDDFAALLRASFALTAVTDIVVAVALCYFLHIRKSGSKSTDSLIRSLMVMTINCGVLSSSIAVAALVTLVVVPHTLLPLSCCILLGKVYTNSLLASLNSRSYTNRNFFSHMTTSSGGPQQDIIFNRITTSSARQRQSLYSSQLDSTARLSSS